MYKSNVTALVGSILALQLVFPYQLLAQTVPLSNAPHNLDLGSTLATVKASPALTSKPTSIAVGGTNLAVTANSLLTPAELVAVYQVVNTGHQSIVLGTQGNAVGGTMTLGSWASQSINNLTIPQGFTVFDKTASLNLAGNLNNSGHLYVISNNPSLINSSISAVNITNQQGALLSSVLPASGLAGLSNLNSSQSLSLSALQTITNSGLISSAGNLNLVAGSAIINSLPAGLTGASPLMQAASNLNLLLQNGNLVNSGLLSSLNGNINISSQAGQNISINNLGGQLQALNGAVNIRDVLYGGGANTTILGGDILSRELNIYSGSGSINADLQNLSSLVNLHAGQAHLSAASTDLSLGSVCLSGDPTFYNTLGDITINSDLVFNGQNLAIVAAGNISSAPGAGKIDTSSAGGNSGSLTLIAGANFSTSGFSSSLLPGPGDSTSTLTITGASATGGKIDLVSAAPVTVLKSSSSAVNGNGGDITLVAYAGSAAGSGSISLPLNLTLSSAGSGSARNGNITVIGEAASGTAVSIGSLNASGGTGGAGNIIVAASKAISTTGSVVIVNGAVQSGQYYIPQVEDPNLAILGSNGLVYAYWYPVTNGTVSAGNLTAGRGASLSVEGNNNVNTGNLNGNGGNIFLISGTPQYEGAGGPYYGLSGSNGNLTTGTISTNGSGNANGGSLAIFCASKQILTIGSSSSPSYINGVISANGSGASGSGGSVTIYNQGSINLAAPNVITVAPSLTGGSAGSIYLNTASGGSHVTIPGGTMSLDASGAGAYNGGSLTISSPAALAITGAVPLLVSANASGTGSGGTLSFTSFNGNLTLGSGAGQLQMSATGGSPGSLSGNGGSVSLSLGSALATLNSSAINVAPVGLNGNGGSISAVSGTLNVVGNLSANGSGAGSGGTISLSASGATPFQVGAGLGCTNCVNGVLAANAGNSSGAGGSISVYGSKGVSLLGANVLSVAPSAAGGNGGSVALSDTSGNIAFSTNSFSVNASGPGNFNGGNISISGAGISTPVGSFTLNANAVGSGNGGSISVSTNSNLAVNSTTGLQLNASGGSLPSNAGNGGTISLKGSNLTIDASAINAGPLGSNGSGASMTLTSTASMKVTNSLNLNGVGNGAGGSLTLNPGGAADFLIGGPLACANCTTTAITANAGNLGGNGGSVTVTRANNIVLAAPQDISVAPSIAGGNGGSISLSTSAGGSSISIPAGTLVADAAGPGNFNGGSISLSTKSLLVTGGSYLTLSANATGTGNGGNLTVSAPLAVGKAAGQLALSANGGSAGSASGSGGNLNLSCSTCNIDPAALSFGPLGQNGNGGSISLSGSAIAVAGTLDAGGSGVGNGGTINISSNSAGTFTIGQGLGCSNCVAGSLLANAGLAGGAGGSISVTSPSGTITLVADNNLSVAASKGNGGSINLVAGNWQNSLFVGGPYSGLWPFFAGNTITLPGGTLSANAAGNGAASGGSIQILAGSLNISGATPLLLAANGAGTGNGGSVSLTSVSGSNLNIGASAGQIAITATGGSGGSNAGNGGSISVSSSLNLTVDGSALNVSPLGKSGNGGSITLSAGANLLINNDLNANGVANGNGGSIALTYNNPGSPLAVTGKINANAPGIGNGGSITIADILPPSGAIPVGTSQAINVNNQGTLSAGSAGGTIGTLNFIAANTYTSPQAVTVNSPGTLIGKINATGSSVNITATQPNTNLNVGQIISSTGAISLSADAPNSSIIIPVGSLISAAGNITLNTRYLQNDGVITSAAQNGNITFTSSSGTLYLNGIGTTYFSGGGSTKIVFGPNVIFLSSLLKFDSSLGRFTSVGQTGLLSGVDGLLSANGLTQFSASSFSTALQTDTTLRSVSIGDASADGKTQGGLVKIGDKFIVVTNLQCLSTFVAGDNSCEFAEEGTEISHEDGDVVLHAGKLVVSTDDREKTVRTPQGKIKLAPRSAAMIKVSVSGTVSVVAMNGNGKYETRSYQTAAESSVSFDKGEELLANEKGLDDEELIPVDGIERGEAISAGISKTTRSTVKRTISLRQVVDKDIMINGSLIHIRGAREAQQKRYLENIKNGVAQQKSLSPVSYIQSVPAPGVAKQAVLAAESRAIFSLSAGARCSRTSTNLTQLDSGELFLRPASDHVVITKYATVRLKKGECLDISVLENGDTVIRSCSGLKSAQVLVARRSAFLNGGEELFVSRRSIKENDVYSSDLLVGHRACRIMHAFGYSFAHSEFSLAGFFATAHIRELMRRDDRNARSLQEKLLKSAVCLQMVLGRKGAYSHSPLK